MAASTPDSRQTRLRSTAERGPTGLPRRWWSWATTIAFLMTAVGFGVYVAFASEGADMENAGQATSAGVRIGTAVGAFLLLAGLIALIGWDLRQGWREGRLVSRLLGAIGLGILAMFAGFWVMLVVVHIAFD